MISYELAKELKAAGFPQGLRECVHGNGVMDLDGTCGCGEEDLVSTPILSELITTCGKPFGRLRKWEDEYGIKWFASAGDCIDPVRDFWEIDKSGDSPEEAVAQVYLLLNQKEDVVQ